MFEKTARLIVIENHPVFVEGIRQIIGKAMAAQVIGVYSNYHEIWESIQADRPDLAIIEIGVIEARPFDFIRDLKKSLPTIAILVFSCINEPLYMKRAIDAGAQGYLGKQESPENFLAAVRSVLDGGYAVNLTGLSRSAEGGSENQADLSRLSNREMEIFNFLGQGENSRQIAEKLYLSAKTVETYKLRMKNKLGLDSTGKLVCLAAVHQEAPTPTAPR